MTRQGVNITGTGGQFDRNIQPSDCPLKVSGQTGFGNSPE